MSGTVVLPSQLHEEILGIHGDKGRDVPKSDLYEGKQSFLVVAACEQLPAKEAQRLLALLGIPREAKTTSDVAAIVGLLDEPDALGMALREIQRIRENIEVAAPAPLKALIAGTMDTMLAPTTQFAKRAMHIVNSQRKT